MKLDIKGKCMKYGYYLTLQKEQKDESQEDESQGICSKNLNWRTLPSLEHERCKDTSTPFCVYVLPLVILQVLQEVMEEL